MFYKLNKKEVYYNMNLIKKLVKFREFYFIFWSDGTREKIEKEEYQELIRAFYKITMKGGKK